MHISNKKFIVRICTFFILGLFIIITIASLPPKKFPSGEFIINVAKDSSINYNANLLYSNNLISSPFLFKVMAVALGNNGLYAGDYKFTKPQNLIGIVVRMTRGIQGIPKIKVTIPEGTNIYEMAYIYMTKLNNFNAPKFVVLAKEKEGYLFPDTYYFLSNTKPEEVIDKMTKNFDEKIKEIKPKIKMLGYDLKSIIILASLIEEEARGIEDKKMISGIIWNRLNKNMLLQIDAPFYYITGRNNGVTYDDLQIDSLYNTYKYKGLPIAPISNPGIESIIAAIEPTSTKYMYYLTGKDGKMRYSITYDGHIKNKNIYLN